MEQNKKCPNVEISDLLPWYYSNTLSDTEIAEVRKHLEVCGHCREQLENIKWIAREIKEMTNEATEVHPTSEQLTLFAEAKDELPENELIQINAHLKDCKTCKKELDILFKVNQTLGYEKLNPVNSIFIKIKESLESIILRPVFVYILVLLLLYPAWLGIFKSGSGDLEPRVIRKNYELQSIGLRSGSEQQNTVLLEKSSDFFSLSVSIPIDITEKLTYNAVILNNDKDIIWTEKNIQPLDQYGFFSVICSGEYFNDGEYLLRITEKGAVKEKLVESFDFPFEVKHIK
jgi:hypothetical protein